MKKRLDIHEGMILSVAVFLALAVFVPGGGLSDFFLTLLSIATFLFGIFVGFTIADRHTRLRAIRRELRENDSRVLDIYRLSSLFGKKVHDVTRKNIDEWITATIDYRLTEFYLAVPKLGKLYDYVLTLKPKTSKQQVAFSQMIDVLENIGLSVKRVRYRVTDKVSRFEWYTILILGGIILFCLFAMNANTYASIIVVVLLSTSLVTIILVLRDLDSLLWKEQKWIWEPLCDLFHELKLLPYIPDEVIYLERASFPKGMKYRYVNYPNPYPSIEGKKIEIKTT